MTKEMTKHNERNREIRKLIQQKARHIRVQTQFGSAVKITKTECLRWLEQLDRRNLSPTYETAELYNGILIIFREGVL